MAAVCPLHFSSPSEAGPPSQRPAAHRDPGSRGCRIELRLQLSFDDPEAEQTEQGAAEDPTVAAEPGRAETLAAYLDSLSRGAACFACGEGRLGPVSGAEEELGRRKRGLLGCPACGAEIEQRQVA
jgi:hypothetical protein